MWEIMTYTSFTLAIFSFFSWLFHRHNNNSVILLWLWAFYALIYEGIQMSFRWLYFCPLHFYINLYRSDTLPPNGAALGVLMEARYFGLDELEDRMNVLPSISATIVRENHRAQFPDYLEVNTKTESVLMDWCYIY